MAPPRLQQSKQRKHGGPWVGAPWQHRPIARLAGAGAPCRSSGKARESPALLSFFVCAAFALSLWKAQGCREKPKEDTQRRPGKPKESQGSPSRGSFGKPRKAHGSPPGKPRKSQGSLGKPCALRSSEGADRRRTYVKNPGLRVIPFNGCLAAAAHLAMRARLPFGRSRGAVGIGSPQRAWRPALRASATRATQFRV